MRNLLAIALLLVVSALSANAQCDPDAQAALYQKFLADYKGSPEQQKMANATGKDYVSKFGECPTEAEQKVVTFIKGWMTKYEATRIEFECTDAVNKAPAQAFERCRGYLAKDPESLRAHLLLSAAGVKISKSADEKLKAETVKSARKSLALINSGKTVDNWILGTTKDEAVATLEYYSAFLTMKETPADTAAAMLKLARSTSGYSKDPMTYFSLAGSIESSELKKQLLDYKQNCEGKDATPECEASYKTIEGTIDRVIDAYARTVALSAGKPEYAGINAAAKTALTDLYKKRHEDSLDGMDRLVADVLAKPIP